MTGERRYSIDYHSKRYEMWAMHMAQGSAAIVSIVEAFATHE